MYLQFGLQIHSLKRKGGFLKDNLRKININKNNNKHKMKT